MCWKGSRGRVGVRALIDACQEDFKDFYVEMIHE